MQPSVEAGLFIERVLAFHAGRRNGSLTEVVSRSLQEEKHLREFMRACTEHERLKNPLVGLVNVFRAPEIIRQTHARIHPSNQAPSRYLLFPLSNDIRRTTGEPCMVKSYGVFLKNWHIFTNRCLQAIDWSYVVAAGGAVHAALASVPKDVQDAVSLKAYYETSAWKEADIDLFLYGVPESEISTKVEQLISGIMAYLPTETECVRHEGVIILNPPKPYRQVQITLGPFDSPAEILASFDIDVTCVLYDGGSVLATPSFVLALMQQTIFVDLRQHGGPYEFRLLKYVMRGFELYMPLLERDKVDPLIYKVPLDRLQGLSLLLALEHQFSELPLNQRVKFVHESSQCHSLVPGSSNNLKRINRKIKHGKVVKKTSIRQAALHSGHLNLFDVSTMARWCGTAYRGSGVVHSRT